MSNIPLTIALIANLILNIVILKLDFMKWTENVLVLTIYGLVCLKLY